MLDMRLRLPELMAAQKLRTAYALAKASKGAIPISTAHRLVEAEGKPDRIDMRTLDALCDTLKCKPSELLARD